MRKQNKTTKTGILFCTLTALFFAGGCSLPASIVVTAPEDSYMDTEEEMPEMWASEKKAESGEYDGTWYAQDESGDILTIGAGELSAEIGENTFTSIFTVREQDDHLRLIASEEFFYYYEINYYADEDRIDAYTQPMLDDDGGYQLTRYRRTPYEPGDEAMIRYIYGDWEIMDGGELLQEPEEFRDILHFSAADYHMMRYKHEEEQSGTYTYELTDLFSSKSDTYDRIGFSFRYGEPKYRWEEVRPEQTFQIMIANNLGMDYLMLRELGDERTGFATYALEYDRSILGTWMFKRPEDDGSNTLSTDNTTPSTVGIENEVRLKGTSFYAIKWLEFGNSCTLQRVETTVASIETETGTEEVLEYHLPDDAYAYSAVNYEYSMKENEAHDGYFDPGLVFVTTDKNGRIKELTALEYFKDGWYYDKTDDET